jgi:hypothetical protein
MIFAASNVKLVCPGRTFALGAALLIFALLGGAGDAVAAPKPRITSPTTASGTIGVPFSYQITADQVITTWGATPLPAGLSVNTTNGLISGTPTVTGTFGVTLSATNGNGTGTATLTLTINPPPNGLFVGVRLPDFLTPAGVGYTPRLMLQMGATQGTTANPFNVTLEVLVPGTTTWVPYNRFVGIGDSASWITDAPLPVRDSAGSSGVPQAFSVGQLTLSPPAVYMKADPRATRFGIFQMDTVLTTTKSRIVLPLWPSGNATVPNGFGGTVGTTFPGPVEHAPNRFSGAAYYPATFAINGPVDARDNATTTYADNDGVTRPADAKYTGGTSGTSTGASTPYYFDPLNPTTSIVYHPVMLNRPFRNVAELGYAFRDLPWKTLDFFTDKSADAGLLDIFTTNDGPPVLDGAGNVVGMAPPTVVAGSLNLNSLYLDPNNSALAPVAQPVLAGALWNDSSATVIPTGSGAQTAQTMMSNIVAATAATQLQNRSELITRANLPTTILPTAANDNQAVKARREVVARATSSVSQTRVWNVLIDVVAQSGRFKPNATSFQNDFIVEGEQHYWVHVAIDRFTGQVIDKQIEVVNE